MKDGGAVEKPVPLEITPNQHKQSRSAEPYGPQQEWAETRQRFVDKKKR